MQEKILEYLKEHGASQVDKISQQLTSDDATSFTMVIKAISQLESQRKIRFLKSGKVTLREEKKKEQITITGTFRANKAGFGFVTVSEEEEDLFVGRNDTGHAIDGDTVEVVITDLGDPFEGKGPSARVVNIVEHALTSVVGRFIMDDEKPKYAGYIRSKNQKISQLIYIRKEPVVLTGDEILKVDIEKYPTRHHDYFVASVRDIIGHKDDVGIDVLEVLESFDIVSNFPDDVIAEANAVPDEPTEKDYIGRVDLRNEVTFTIDGADAKDLDDAVHIKQLENGNYELGVHIADVSYYVTEGSALNREAVARGTSVYVTDRVVPMLPERLSNGICSLNPNVDRLTQSCIMEITPQGKVVDYQITQSVINTTFRMTYTAVNEILAGDEELIEEYQPIVESIHQMAALHRILENMRIRRGALNFDTSEAKIIVDKKGAPVDIVLRQRGIAERMIESFMLAANETVAEHFAKLELPFIYRIHEEPKAEKLQKFIDYASIFGVAVQGTANKISQKALQEFMAKVEGQPGSEVLAMMLLRSMQQARYSEQNHGHYGLAAEYYTHFTSPIRRYPDLLVHRLIREYGQVTAEKIDHYQALIPELASSSSTLERRAIDAERVVEGMKKAEFMEEYVGEVFDGVVSSVVKFGLFVELPNTVEGLIHITNLPDYFNYNERTMTLTGEITGLSFKAGQEIRVKLIKADKETGEIDFKHVKSDFDVKEKVNRKERKDKRDKKKNNRRSNQSHRDHQGKNKKHKEKSKKAFYKDVAKKGGKNGKRGRKGSRSK